MILITGGSGSGKSAYGEKRILEAGEMTRYYIATMEVFGEEGRKKVERHKKLRQGKTQLLPFLLPGTFPPEWLLLSQDWLKLPVLPVPRTHGMPGKRIYYH